MHEASGALSGAVSDATGGMVSADMVKDMDFSKKGMKNMGRGALGNVVNDATGGLVSADMVKDMDFSKKGMSKMGRNIVGKPSNCNPNPWTPHRKT